MTTDRWTVRAVVVAIILAVLVCIAAEVFLATTSTAIPDQLDRVTNLLIGGLLGLLIKTSSNPSPDDPVPVTVDTTTSGPVPVKDTPALLDPPAPLEPPAHA